MPKFEGKVVADGGWVGSDGSRMERVVIDGTGSSMGGAEVREFRIDKGGNSRLVFKKWYSTVAEARRNL